MTPSGLTARITGWRAERSEAKPVRCMRMLGAVTGAVTSELLVPILLLAQYPNHKGTRLRPESRTLIIPV